MARRIHDTIPNIQTFSEFDEVSFYKSIVVELIFFYFCHRFDHSGKGELTEKELYNVLKMQNQVDCTKEEVSEIEITITKHPRGKAIKTKQHNTQGD